MKKADFLKQENVPQFIKDLVEMAPEDEVCFKDISFPGCGNTQEDRCSECEEVNEDCMDISVYLDCIANNLCSMMRLVDCKGRVSKNDLRRFSRHLDVMSGIFERLNNYVDYGVFRDL